MGKNKSSDTYLFCQEHPNAKIIIAKIYRSAAWQLEWFSLHVAEYFSPHTPAEKTASSRIDTGIPIARVKAYGVTQV